ncbi:hypothetical protein [Belnapia rosea]
MADFIPESPADFKSESVADMLRNPHAPAASQTPRPLAMKAWAQRSFSSVMTGLRSPVRLRTLADEVALELPTGDEQAEYQLAAKRSGVDHLGERAEIEARRHPSRQGRRHAGNFAVKQRLQ